MSEHTPRLHPSPRERLLLDPNWKFHLGEPEVSEAFSDDPHMDTYLSVKTGMAHGPAGISYDDAGWRTVDLPHDWAVEGTFDPACNMDHGYLPTGIGWYRKAFSVPESDLGKRLLLEFDGVFRHSTVWLNGHRLGTQPSGYTSFRYDITDIVEYGGANTVAVRVDATEYEGWWYEGAGIYRHVWLVKTDPLRVAPWGLFVYSRPVDGLETWDVVIQVELANDFDRHVRSRIESVVHDPSGRIVGRARSARLLSADSTVVIEQRIRVAGPRLWSVETPALYTLATTVREGGRITDAVETTFGFRTFRFDAQQGFFLNGQPLKLKGTCNHQDHAGVGVALPDRLHEYRIERLKEMGCNAYRCAHNPPAPELLDACDRLGMLVMDEARHMDATPQGRFELESLVRRDRNHPSIILWSLGNEEPIQGTHAAGRIVTTMKRLVRKLDPTRPVTIAMNGGWGGPVTQAVDVQGCNYFIQLYDDFHHDHPDKPAVAAENGSTVCTRGVYANDPARGYVSAYDANHPDWAFLAETSWQAVAERPWMSGTFVWTGFDYRGEPTPYRWPCINSHFGIMDTCGFPKDNYYYYQAWWSDRVVLHLLPHWNWPGREGETIDVWAHSNCDVVELWLNGVLLGTQRVPRNGHVEWKVPYAPGALQAKGYTGGRLVATATRKTTGAPARIALQPDRASIRADGQDVAVVNASVRDAEGLVVPTAGELVRFSLSGPGRILGVGNGDPSCHEPDKPIGGVARRSAFNGWCQIIVQAGREAGEMVLRAEAEGLEPESVVITTDRAEARPAL